MTCLRGSALALVLALGMLLNGAVARADAGTPSLLVLDEPKSGIHIELPGACLAHVKNAAMGTPTCPDRAAAGESEALAVVGGDGEGGGDGKGAHYSVDIVVDEIALGTGEDRAKRMAKELSEAVAEPPTVVTFAEQRFVRARLRWTNGGGVCFVTADDRKEAAAVIFLSLDAESVADVEKNADAAMATLRRAPVKAEPSPRAGALKAGGSDAIVIVFGVIVVGLLALWGFAKFYFIARLFGFKLGGADKRIEEPRRPRDPRKDGPQVAGMKCAGCKRNIVSDREGMHCADCDRPIHKECHGKHVTDAHVATAGAYR